MQRMVNVFLRRPLSKRIKSLCPIDRFTKFVKGAGVERRDRDPELISHQTKKKAFIPNLQFERRIERFAQPPLHFWPPSATFCIDYQYDFLFAGYGGTGGTEFECEPGEQLLEGIFKFYLKEIGRMIADGDPNIRKSFRFAQEKFAVNSHSVHRQALFSGVFESAKITAQLLNQKTSLLKIIVSHSRHC